MKCFLLNILWIFFCKNSDKIHVIEIPVNVYFNRSRNWYIQVINKLLVRVTHWHIWTFGTLIKIYCIQYIDHYYLIPLMLRSEASLRTNCDLILTPGSIALHNLKPYWNWTNDTITEKKETLKVKTSHECIKIDKEGRWIRAYRNYFLRRAIRSRSRIRQTTTKMFGCQAKPGSRTHWTLNTVNSGNSSFCAIYLKYFNT